MQKKFSLIAWSLALVIITFITTDYFCSQFNKKALYEMRVENARLDLNLAQAKLGVVKIAQIHFGFRGKFMEEMRNADVTEGVLVKLSSIEEDYQGMEGLAEKRDLLTEQIVEKEAWLKTILLIE